MYGVEGETYVIPGSWKESMSQVEIQAVERTLKTDMCAEMLVWRAAQKSDLTHLCIWEIKCVSFAVNIGLNGRVSQPD